MALTNAQMLAAVAAGSTIQYNGRTLKVAGDVPSDAQIALDAASNAPATNVTDTSPLSVSLGTVTAKTNAGFSAPGQTIKNYTGSITSSASVATTVPLETVTAGKTYVLTDIYISSNTATQFEARIQANGVDIFRGWCKGDTSPISLAGIESQPNASSGQVVTLLIPVIAGSPQVSFFLGGLEQ